MYLFLCTVLHPLPLPISDSYAKRALSCQLEAFGLDLNASSLAELESNLMAMWAEHGDQMARQYGGSGAMHKVDQGMSSSSSYGQVKFK